MPEERKDGAVSDAGYGTGKSATVRKSRLAIIRDATEDALGQMTEDQLGNPALVENKILSDVADAFGLEKQQTGRKLAPLNELMPSQIAEILIMSYPVARIAAAGLAADADSDILAVYQYDGPDEGTYVSSDAMLRGLMRKYDYKITKRDAEEVEAVLLEELPRRTVCREKNLVAVNNGIFDYDTKTLMPFTEDKIFLTKSHVDYVPGAPDPVIHNDEDGTDWDVESWMNGLSDDSEIVNLLWEILGAIIRPLVPWNKSAWFYSETGNNGKGTLCELMRQLCGEGAYASIPLSSFSQDFMLEPLIRASAVITDENDVGTYIDKAANLKAVITGDAIQVNRKYKTPVSFAFRGFMVQCLNEMPRIRDRSDSFFRRQLFVPFDKCFTGNEKKYIKRDYMHRPEVLQYVLCRVLNMDYYSLSEPEACRKAMEEYREFNDPIRQFARDTLGRCAWDLLPYEFMFDLYRSWYRRTAGSDGRQKGKAAFLKDFKQIVQEDYPEWEVLDSPVSPGNMMSVPEPMIAEYSLDSWKNPCYHGTDESQICTPALRSSYRGFRRVSLVDFDD